MTDRGVVPKLKSFDRVAPIVEEEEATLSLADWRERLRSDPEGTVANLLRRFGPRRSSAPEVEALFWRVLVDYGRPEDLAHGVLGRVRVPGSAPDPLGGGLLDLDHEHRIRVRGRLRVAAAEVLRAVVRDAKELDAIVRHPVRLPQAAYASRGRPSEAAALYVLEHDQHCRPPDEPGAAAGANPLRSSSRRLSCAALRYETARSLHRVEGGREDAFAVMQTVVRLVDEALAQPESAVAGERLALGWRLSFHAREWLGLRHYENGRYGEAVREFERAADAAPETDLAVAARMFAANALIRDGRVEEARRLLDVLREATARLAPPLSDEWQLLSQRLIDEATAPEDDED